MQLESVSSTEELDIQIVEAATWPEFPHQQRHCQLVYILAGQGCYLSDDQHYTYEADDIFLLKTSHVSWFCSSQPTRFCVVSLPMDLVREAHTAFGELLPVFAQCRFRGSPELTAEDKAYVREQVHFCLREHAQPQPFGSSLLRANVSSVVMLVRRAYIRMNHPTMTAHAPSSESQVNAVVTYVRQHLKEPAYLTAKAIGAHFNQRPRYVGQYFRQHLGRGLKRFVEENRIYAIQQELRYTDKTISQLAFEYGFSDESHLGKVFKGVTYQTPLAYRRAWVQGGSLNQQASLAVGRGSKYGN